MLEFSAPIKAFRNAAVQKTQHFQAFSRNVLVECDLLASADYLERSHLAIQGSSKRS
jgi:hypothetical protein